MAKTGLIGGLIITIIAMFIVAMAGDLGDCLRSGLPLRLCI